MLEYAPLQHAGRPHFALSFHKPLTHLLTLQGLPVLLCAAAAADRFRRWRFLLLKAAIFGAVFWFVSSTLKKAIDELTRADWRFDLPSIGLSAVFYILGLVPAGVFWWWLLKRMSQRVSLLAAMRAYFIGHLGKYVPGKAMVVVLRAGMVKSAGADVALATIAVLIETLTMMACGALLSLVLIAALVPPDWKLALAAALAITTGGPALPPLLNRLLRRFERKTPQTADGAVDESDDAPQQQDTQANLPMPTATSAIDWRAMAIGWAAMLVLWILLGLSLSSILHGLAPDVPRTFEGCLTAIAAVALATVAGFLSLLPGGLVVRELILLDLLAPQVGDATALVAALLLRLVWLLAEIVVSGSLYFAGKPD